MDQLPPEILLNIITCTLHLPLYPTIITPTWVNVKDIVHVQSLSRRFLALSRDSNLWKIECFTHSRAEAQRQRQQLIQAQDAGLAALREAVGALPVQRTSRSVVIEAVGDSGEVGQDARASDVEREKTRSAARKKAREQLRALANWDPSYPGESVDWYQEYIHRHAPISVGWLQLPSSTGGGERDWVEATGIGMIRADDGETAAMAVAPLNDGSVCVWDIAPCEKATYSQRGRLLGKSPTGLLSGRVQQTIITKAIDQSKTIMTEIGAVECVSVDSRLRKAYFAVQNTLNEVDLNTLQLVHRETYPFPITALSAADQGSPVAVGTNWTIHVHDPRNKRATSSTDTSIRCELIGGSAPSTSHASLAQPGPLSIQNLQASNSIWVAGRFTSLLSYDRRFFPRLLGTLHSGARITCLSVLQRPYVPRTLDLLRNPNVSLSALQAAKVGAGVTLVAAGEYKGKGSLELYGIPTQFSSAFKPTAQTMQYQNRQTASGSKLLSVAPHGTRLLFSDGDGNLKWVERDGSSLVRTFNINSAIPDDTRALHANNHRSDTYNPHSNHPYNLFAGTADELPGQGDIVQKLIPTLDPCPLSSRASSSNSSSCSKPSDVLLWTGDGRLGLLSFGHESKIVKEAVERVESTEERARGDAERQHSMAMRRALERQADEVRFVRGLGMGYM
ncbi:hypothetical protein LTR28_001490 [Elasticomyces elasticus]|nr:hypothetical protein LTR28_001490 [Elasticomyces elasticus]